MMMRSIWGVVLALVLSVGPAWAQSAPQTQKVSIQGTPTGDGDTGGATQTVTLFGIALPASGGAVFGGTSTNPLNVVFPSAQSVTGSGNFTVVQPTGSNLHIVCDSGCSSASGFADNAAFTFGTTSINPIGGVLDDTGTNAATENSAAIARITAQKALHMNLRNNSGTEVGTSGAPLRFDPTGSTTQPVSLASVPSHAVTNAGTFATQIDGAALTALQLIDNIVNTIGSTTSGSSGVLGLCGVTTSAPTYTTGQSHPCSLQTDGSLRVYLTGAANGSVSNDDDGTIADGGTNHTTVLPLTYAWNSDSGVADWTRLMHQPLDFDSGAGTENLSVIGIGLPASGGPVIGGTSSNPFNVVFPSAQAITVASLPLPTGAATEATLANTLTSANFAAAFGTAGSADSQVMSIQGIASMTPVQVQSNSANLATQTTLASILTAVELIDNAISGAGFNITQMGGTNLAMNTGTRSAGTQRVTIATDDIVPASQSGTWTVQPGNTANTTPWLMSLIPSTSGGTTPCYIPSAASTNATNCKASAGQLYGYEIFNTTATAYYLRLYNLSSAPTCSSATGFVRSIPVPPYSAAGGVGGVVIDKSNGEAYGTGLGFCLTGGGSSTDNTNAATGVYVTLNYK